MADEKEIPTEFRPCVDEGYEINSTGVVRNRSTGRVLKYSQNNGYPAATLSGRKYRVHRLVALAWLPPPDNSAATHVNHDDGDTSNCNVSNLVWTTPAENTQHARDTGLIAKTKRGKAVESVDAEGNTKQYISMLEAARAVGVAPRAITQVVDCPGRRCKGLLWRATEPAEQEGEEWREPPECDGKVFAFAYSVSNQGRIKGPKGLMNPATSKDGYENLHLVTRNEAGEHENYAFKLHRVVATAFHGPAPHPQSVAHHDDGDRSNNKSANLFWTTQKMNTIFARGRPVVQKTLDGEFVAKFASMTLAAEAVGRAATGPLRAIQLDRACAGYRWEYG